MCKNLWHRSIEIFGMLWCGFFHYKCYTARPNMNIGKLLGVHCAKCNTDFLLSEKTFNRIGIK